MIVKKPMQKIIAITGGSTTGKTTLVDILIEKMNDKRDYITVIRLDHYIYPDYQRPKTMMQGRLVSNLDTKESIDWENFFDAISNINTPIIFIDGFITFADDRSCQLVDALITLYYNDEIDFDTALYRRVKKSNCHRYDTVPANYLENTWENNLNYYCTYFHDIVWPEMIAHPEYRKPYNWCKPTLELSATKDINLNVMTSLNFIYQIIQPFLSQFNN